MRAVVLTGFGSGPRLTNVRDLRPTVGTVLVRVDYASINAADGKLAFGVFPEAPGQPYPVTLGRDVAGTVVDVGAGVDRTSIGSEVFGFVPDRPLVHGSFAEYTVIDATALVSVPAGLPPSIAAVLPAAGTTALAAVNAAGIRPGDHVLVIGANGGVGTIVVQLAAARGAVVEASAHPDDVDHLTDIGVSTVFDRHALPKTAEYDCLIDLTATGAAFDERLALVRPSGRAVSTLHASANSAASRDRGITVSAVNGASDPQALSELADAAVTGVLRVPITRSVTLDEVPEALHDFRSRHTSGKWSVVAGG